MKNENLISDYLSGKLIGDIIANRTDKKLTITRYFKSRKINSVNNLILLHRTKGFIDDNNIGCASTYLDGDLEIWQNFKSIRMNELLGKYGYTTSDYHFITDTNEISRTIKSTMEFGTIIIKEKIFFTCIN